MPKEILADHRERARARRDEPADTRPVNAEVQEVKDGVEPGVPLAVRGPPMGQDQLEVAPRTLEQVHPQRQDEKEQQDPREQVRPGKHAPGSGATRQGPRDPVPPARPAPPDGTPTPIAVADERQWDDEQRLGDVDVDEQTARDHEQGQIPALARRDGSRRHQKTEKNQRRLAGRPGAREQEANVRRREVQHGQRGDQRDEEPAPRPARRDAQTAAKETQRQDKDPEHLRVERSGHEAQRRVPDGLHRRGEIEDAGSRMVKMPAGILAVQLAKMARTDHGKTVGTRVAVS